MTNVERIAEVTDPFQGIGRALPTSEWLRRVARRLDSGQSDPDGEYLREFAGWFDSLPVRIEAAFNAAYDAGYFDGHHTHQLENGMDAGIEALEEENDG